MSVAGLVRFKGAAVTFTVTNPGTYDATTDTYSSDTTSTVAGYALRAAGDPERYRALNLVESENPTLEFVPTTAGEVPPLNATVTFGGFGYVVRDVEPVAQNGTATRARVIVSRGT